MTWVYPFNTDEPVDRDILGGKGAGLVEMRRAGFPVPPGFVISTSACLAYTAAHGVAPEELWDEVAVGIASLESVTGKTFGGATDPLLLSVRSGAAVSMPGMMDTVLNLGLNDTTVEALAKQTGDSDFAWQSYRRFVHMFGEIVFRVPSERLSAAVATAHGSAEPDAASDQVATARLKMIIEGHASRPVPQDPVEQLHLAIAAVFDSWDGRRAVDYRRVHGISDALGTAVSVQTMVFGNSGKGSGTGVAFTRDPGTGERKMYGEYLDNAQGEDVVAGIRTPLSLDVMATEMPDVHQQLLDISGRLESHYRDMQDIEFTVERGKLWMLQTRSGKRSARAAIRIAVELFDEKIISREEAVLRVTPDRLEELLHPVVHASTDDVVLARGLAASPGGASGVVVFDADEAVELAEEGKKVVLVRHETSPDDFHGMVAAQAIVTTRGGVTSHAAVVARGMGKSCVVGCEDIEVDYAEQLFHTPKAEITKGDWVTVDGTTGAVYLGEVETVSPELDDNYSTLMGWADEFRELAVRANADTPVDAARARELGAEGIGLCRSEHMFFGDDRTAAMREMIMAPNAIARADALTQLAPLQAKDYAGIFEAMDGFPVTVRLLDPPLHEFLPDRHETIMEITNLKLRLRKASSLEAINTLLGRINELETVLDRIERLSEANPMLGHRGCRLGIAYPEITEMQARAIFTAAVQCADKGIAVFPEVMVPLVAFESEFVSQSALVRETAEKVFAELGASVDYAVGTMIELPRAALVAGRIAEHAEFFSFGTNDLTQSTVGLSRDDAGRFLPGYIRRGLIDADPFRSIDREGVGELVSIGVERGRKTKPDLKIGVCGEHGGDPSSVAFFHEIGLDYVSSSPFRVPIARLAAAHVSLQSRTSSDA